MKHHQLILMIQRYGNYGLGPAEDVSLMAVQISARR